MAKQVVRLCFFIVFLLAFGTTSLGEAEGLFRGETERSFPPDELAKARQATVQLLLIFSDSQLEQIEAAVVKRTSGYSGLGSLVVSGKNTILLTHNHWGDLTEVIRVQVRTVDGHLVGDVSGDTFRHWILYRDEGTLALAVPVTFTLTDQLQPAQIGSENAVTARDTVLVARQDPNEPGKVAFLQAEVISLDHQAGPPIIRLHNQDGEPIVRGDSGGGIWLAGQLVGNSWKTDVLAGWGLPSLQTGQRVEHHRDTFEAAQIPGELIGLLTSLAWVSTAAETVTDNSCLVYVDC